MTIINFGCGPFPSTGCLNIDGSPTVLLARFVPAFLFVGAHKEVALAVRRYQVRFGRAKTIAFPNASVDGLYASHVLEHLPRRDCLRLLGKIRCWLKPSGVLRVVLPDLRGMARAYVEGAFSADEFVERTHLAIQGALAIRPSHHRWMYDVDSLSRLLEDAGYTEMRERGFREGRTPEVAELDLAERRAESFYVEAQP
ncbi:MAG TPA: methyltransferase domain-containing protein [Candidatus Binataceae bacterium]|nr:methyltransferase domain-containing protein [Candidatus Binataceae bacterium]